LAETVAKVVGFNGQIAFDTSKPDGSPRKLMNIERLNAAGWKPRTSFRDGLALAYDDFRSRSPDVFVQ